MNVVASITYDRRYFQTFYRDWMKHRSRWRRFAIPMAIGLVALAVFGLVVFPASRNIAVFVLVICICNLVDASTHRFRWIRKQLASVAVDKSATFTLTDDSIQISSPNSEGTLKYEAFGLMTITPNGIFLVPDSGYSIYLPRSSFADSNQFEAACARLEELSEGDEGQRGN